MGIGAYYALGLLTSYGRTTISIYVDKPYQMIIHFAVLVAFGRMMAYSSDVIMLRPPAWARHVLFVVDIKGPSIGICAIIWQIILYLMILFPVLWYSILRPFISPLKYVELSNGLIWIGTWVGVLMCLYAALCHGFMSRKRRIEIAIGCQFDNDIWRSSSRKIFYEKFEYAEKMMTALVSAGKVEVKKAEDLIDRRVFEKYGFGNSTYFAANQIDPLSGRKVHFLKNHYYFYAPQYPGLILKLENYIRDNWKDDTGKKKRNYW